MNQLQMLKKAMISYVTNSAKVIWSEILYPTIIKGKKNCNLIGYRIYGNSTQSGTPTPTSPKEINSVGELVTEGENAGKYRVSVKVSGLGKEEIVDIFLDEPLRKVGDYKDEIDFEKGQVTRRIYHEKITKVNTQGATNRYLSPVAKRPYVEEGVAHCLSTKFKPGNVRYSQITNTMNIIKTYRTSAQVDNVVYSLKSSTLADAQAEIGDGFDVIYVLNKATTENVDLTPLPQFNGTTIYEVLTDTPPSGIEVCYYG